MKRLRVLHVPDAVGGNPQGISRAERALGVESRSVVFAPSPYAYEADEILRPDDIGPVRYAARRAALLARALAAFDVVHFNFGRTMAPKVVRYADLPLLRAAGKIIAVTFQGDDARRGDLARERGYGLPLAIPERYPPSADVARARCVAAFDRYADLLFFLNPDLAPALPARAEFVPYAHVDARSVPAADVREGPIRVVHAPSDRVVKGTNHVIEAVETLRATGAEIELRLIEGVSNAEARRISADSDVAVDQLHAGWYGGFAVEVMASGTPVVAFIEQRDLGVIPEEMRRELPIVSATPAALTSVLAKLAGEGRHALVHRGHESRAFVARWHDPLKIAAMLLERYQDAIRERRRTKA